MQKLTKVSEVEKTSAEKMFLDRGLPLTDTVEMGFDEVENKKFFRDSLKRVWINGFKSHQELTKDNFVLTKEQLVDAILFGMLKGLNIDEIPETDSDWINNYIKSLLPERG